MNIGTIVEAPLLKVRLVGKRRFGPVLGEIEEYFVNLLRPGDTFMFAGRLLRFLRLHEMAVECAEGGDGDPMVPAYEGGRLPLTTNLADRVRGLLQDPATLGRVSRSRCRTGCGCNGRARACPGGTICWWRRFPAATAGTWSPIASRAATRTRRWACC